MIKIKIENQFHDTEIFARAPESWLQENGGAGFLATLSMLATQGDNAAKKRLARIDKKLCGMRDCYCSKIIGG